jgi:hypothetical protein
MSDPHETVEGPPVSGEASAIPIPFFRVLEEEYAQLRGGAVPRRSWTLEEEHLVGNVAQMPKELLHLASPGQESITKAELKEALNRLLEAADLSLSKCAGFPQAAVSKGLQLLDGLKLGKDDRIRVNRLLLESAFPDHVLKVDTVHLISHYRRIHREGGPAALCISGGGIRSATFALGILQGLARHGVLKGFEYLSTVSGGGYIGSWLSSWIHRRREALAVQNELGRSQAISPLQPEPEPVRNLRAYSNYLTPKLGFLSADTWTLAGIYLTNLLMNWLVFVPLLMAIFALPRLGLAVLHMDPREPVKLGVLASGFAMGVWGLTFAMLQRPSNGHHRPERKGMKETRPGQIRFLLGCLIPLWISAICLTTFWVWWNGKEFVSEGFLGRIPMACFYVALGIALHLVSWLISRIKIRKVVPIELAAVFLTGLIGGILLWGMARAASHYVVFHEDDHSRLDNAGLVRELLYVCFAPPAFLGAMLLAGALFVGLVSRFTSDGDREWWARMGAWILVTLTCWAGFCVVTLLGPIALFNAKTLLTAAGGLSGLFTLLIARGDGTPARKGEGDPAPGWKKALMHRAMSLTTPLFIAFLVTVLSIASGLLIYVLSNVNLLGFRPLVGEWEDQGPMPSLLTMEAYLRAIHLPSEILTGVFIALALGFGAAMSLVIDINRFSIHALYRNRLVRAYLGASNSKRQPNPFTGFDPLDDLPISDLRPQKPLHVVNIALNLVGGDNLAWQERKAESFTASPLHCGSHRLGYRRSEVYGKHVGEMARRRNKPSKDEGVTLGTMVAISGAAASPNMGYHSSPVIAALMTFFNIRLGWWLGNPGAAGQSSFDTPAPGSGILYMAKEAFGLTNDSNRYVYLSDGGHFENLGLYEMVLRRCRLIVVSDAGSDPKCTLEDLGNAIRKIRIDQGVEITLKKFGIYSRDDAEGKGVGKYCAIGEIDYGRSDREEGGTDPLRGILIYLKPALCGNEPKDVYNYQSTSSAFPNESTADQWFAESQFESYRALALHIIESLWSVDPGSKVAPLTRDAELDRFAASAIQYTELGLPGVTQAK